ncbi:unnamed protein product [Protopolystoma xenopodis]|uniref:Uncharacterized protein n=1 Tax=Protopolystoma xenopodis TaxID=117903 RepID=A0A448XT52_9PLAT|nr:unnamed protein product [Protopolystoma xenopodis]
MQDGVSLIVTNDGERELADMPRLLLMGVKFILTNYGKQVRMPILLNPYAVVNSFTTSVDDEIMLCFDDKRLALVAPSTRLRIV